MESTEKETLEFIVTLPVINGTSKPLQVILEPVAEQFIVQPGQRIEVVAICEEPNQYFEVEPYDKGFIVWAPRGVFFEHYAMRDGVRLEPEPWLE